jgi:hypothetical protein
MGLFDEITCKAPLPRPEMQHRVFQSKSLDCEPFQDGYTITEDGQLVRHCRENRVHEDESAFFGFYVVADRKWDEAQSDFHGDVYFYDWERAGDTTSPLITFRARFTNGRLQDIIEVPDTETTDAP